tara:strand:- start:468 stop:836 length:369 start_codon:yes stop_codon:yes gene_type:complete
MTPIYSDDESNPPEFCPVCRSRQTQQAISEHLAQAIEGVPDYMQGQVRGYIENGLPPGGFLTAILENNLSRSVEQADTANQAALIEWARVLSHMPRNMWGSPETVNAHLDRLAELRTNPGTL